MIDKFNNAPLRTSRASQTGAALKSTPKDGGGGFGELFQKELAQVRDSQQSIAFSKHAMARAEERGIAVDDTLLDQLSESVEKAQAKGATNILAFDATRAFIVNVPNGRVITAMSQEEMKENIFTNIDGAVIL